jgi:hypothetical protein
MRRWELFMIAILTLATTGVFFAYLKLNNKYFENQEKTKLVMQAAMDAQQTSRKCQTVSDCTVAWGMSGCSMAVNAKLADVFTLADRIAMLVQHGSIASKIRANCPVGRGQLYCDDGSCAFTGE